mmetsp:Transcript_26922/g.20139  ORF Transcript_26922/g.20139 Transcript_26922/m.20139 type:complete len:87 (-) Transcript_26922:109-369(-)|eukprot:CAMPEP_0202969908 /NCGR_PEP_ID=MMETSP1396-20130829/15815_1 /ASSEMBLY_ACC=CAM_ASM_000872 /TAXON_ID= /ORGANISM="Pseudokeronopsis sp., Strain Brazil" /LENGTH=86 /DNA_ID=CAMNT_0049697977 /DNA_START=704 /DNA_END=964 /DNA_ORIENTATION=+
MPYADYNQLVPSLEAATSHLICQFGFCYSYTACGKIAKKLENLVFAFGTTVDGEESALYTLTPDDYLIDGSEFDRPGTCFVGILGA